MADTVIAMRDVSKRYTVFDNQWSRLRHALLPGVGTGVRDVWALHGVSLEVARGEAVAVIGRNGGGKSTLLEILTGTLQPTSGEVKVSGRVSALLELGSGFNPEYTGRDNVVLNGILLGLTRGEVLRRFDEIAAFADIGEAIDRPVKTYSSGMMMRLAFAVQVLTDPEILVIDEALSVGDFFFQQKCFAYIRALRQRGVTLVFVSHDMRTVRDLCDKAIYLRQGRVAFAGEVRTAIRSYFAELSPSGGPAADVPAATVLEGGGATDIPPDAFWRRPSSRAAGPLLAVDILDAQGNPATHARIGETLRIRVYFATAPGQDGHVSLVFKNRYDQVVSTVGSFTSGHPSLSSGGAPFGVFQVDVGMMLEAGQYSLLVAFARPVGKNKGEPLDDTGWLGPLQVDWDYERETAPFLGMFGLPVHGELLSAQAAGDA